MHGSCTEKKRRGHCRPPHAVARLGTIWIRRYDGGLDGLLDLPRCGRPRSIPASTLNRIIFDLGSSRITPVMLQQVMHEKAGRKLHITYVRKIMRRHGLSPKASQKIHIRRANGKTVKNWQHDIKKWISRMENEGFVVGGRGVVMEDEAFFVHDAATGRKCWPPVASPVTCPIPEATGRSQHTDRLQGTGGNSSEPMTGLTQRPLPDT